MTTYYTVLNRRFDDYKTALMFARVKAASGVRMPISGRVPILAHNPGMAAHVIQYVEEA